MRMLAVAGFAGSAILAGCSSEWKTYCTLNGENWNVGDTHASIAFNEETRDDESGELIAVIHSDELLRGKGAIFVHTLVVERNNDSWVVRNLEGDFTVSTSDSLCGEAITSAVRVAQEIHSANLRSARVE